MAPGSVECYIIIMQPALCIIYPYSIHKYIGSFYTYIHVATRNYIITDTKVFGCAYSEWHKTLAVDNFCWIQ